MQKMCNINFLLEKAARTSGSSRDHPRPGSLSYVIHQVIIHPTLAINSTVAATIVY